MRRYSYAINSIYKTASLIIEDAPRWVFMLCDFFDFVCEAVPEIKLPPFPLLLSNKMAIELNDGNRRTTFSEWYGSVSGWFCLKFHLPIIDFCFNRTDTRIIDIDYNKIKEATEKYDKWWKEAEKWNAAIEMD